MKQITVRRLDLIFDADQITHGTDDEQANQAMNLINEALAPCGFGAFLIAHADEIEVGSEDSDAEECDECGASIPFVLGSDGCDLTNKHHLESCSLYDAEKE